MRRHRPPIGSATPCRCGRPGPRRGQGRARRLEALDGHRPRRAPGRRPGHRAPVEAVDHRAQVALLARREPELGDVGDPQLVGRRRPEPVGAVGAQRQVRRGGRDLAGVAAPPAAAGPGGAEPLLAHQPADDLLRDAHAAPPQLGVDRPVAAPPHRLEGVGDERAQPPVPVPAEPGAVVLIGAPRYPQESGDAAEGQAGGRPQSLAELALAPVRHRSQVRACPF